MSDPRTLVSRRRVLAGLGLLATSAACPRTRSAPAAPLDATPEIPDDDPWPDAAPAPSTAPPAVTCAETADNLEGPFYLPGAPARTSLVGPRDGGERLILGGAVRSTGCAPLAGAVIEVWQADARGVYDETGYRFRAALRTGDDGAWQLATVVPGRYLNGRRYRPAHIHVKVRAPGHRALTTQLYFAGDPYNLGDPFIVDSLIMASTVDRGVRRARYDLVLPSLA